MKYLRLVTTLLVLFALMAMTVNAGSLAKKSQGLDGSGLVPKVLKAGNGLHTSKHVQSRQAVEQAETQAINEEAQYNAATMQTYGQSSIEAKISPTLPKDRKSVSSLTAMSGTYTVGVGGDIPSLIQAVGILNFLGVSGPVTFLLTDASYTETGLVLGSVTGASATNTITFQPASTVTTVTINLINSATNGGGWVFKGAKYVTINGTKVGGTPGSKDLTIKWDAAQTQPASLLDAPICLRDGTRYDKFLNINFQGLLSTTSGTPCISSRASTGIDSVSDPDFKVLVLKNNSYNAIKNCSFTNARTGVFFNGLLATTSTAQWAYYEYGDTIANSTFTGLAQWGIRMDNCRNAAITGNTISNISYPATFAAEGGRVGGIRTFGILNHINNNYIDNAICNLTTASSNGRTYGIRIMGPSGGGAINGSTDPYVVAFKNYLTGNSAKNNSISRIFTAAAASGGIGEIGIEQFGTVVDTLIGNSVYMTGTALNATGTACYMGQGNRLFGAHTVVKNCVFYNDRFSASQWSLGMRFFNYASTDYDYGTVSDHNVINGPDGVASDLSAFEFFTMYEFGQYEAGTDAHSSAGNPYFVSATDLHFQSGQPSAAAELGGAGGLSTDITGAVRGTPPDAGAFEGSISVTKPQDILMQALLTPPSTGVPQNLPITKMEANVVNLCQDSILTAQVKLVITDPSSVEVYNHTVAVEAMGWGGAGVASFTAPFTPTATGDYTFTLVSVLATDANATNDTVVATVPCVAVTNYFYSTDFETAPSRAGWGTAGDFALASVAAGDTKLGGAHSGDASYQTNPGPTGTYYSSPYVVSYLYSPFFDFRNATKAKISFWHALLTEPGWDRSIMEYTVDSGKTWKTLGVTNDPDGVNWYSTGLYTNAAGGNPNCFDETSGSKGWPAENPGVEPNGNWTSNGVCDGDDIATGPFGFYKVSYNMTNLPAARTPLGKNFVRFRYAAWSDYSGTDDGWAVDDFSIDTTITPILPATIAGMVYLDANGNGTNDAEAAITGVHAILNLFGAPVETTAVDPSGNFVLHLNKGLGTYTLTSDVAGKAFTGVPAAVDYTGDGVNVTGKDLGYFVGSVSGKVYDDVNGDGSGLGDAGLAGWTVEVHKDSANGALVATTTSGVGGLYTFDLGPGAYAVKEIVPATGYRRTAPVGGSYTFSIAAPSGTSAVTGEDFGNFTKASITVFFGIDNNGDGVLNDPILKCPGGIQGNFKVRNGVSPHTLIKYDSLGNLINTDFTIANLDTGKYFVVKTRPLTFAGYLNTNPADTVFFNITTGGVKDTAKYLMYKLPVINGHVYVDGNGNSKKDGGDAAISGYTVALSGPGAATTTTDGSGNYSFTGVLPGAHNVTLTLPTGSFTITKGSAGYTSPGFSSGQTLVDSFGVFTNVTIAGTVYRDRNNSGALDGTDDGLAATVWLKKVFNAVTTWTSTTSAVDGSFSFADLGPGVYTDTVALPSGYGQTEPLSGGYDVTAASGVNTSGQHFGFFQLTDNTKYQTLNMAALLAAWNSKPGDHTKTGVKGTPTVANLLAEVLPTPITVGIVPGPALQPKKYGDVWKTLKNKGGATQSTLPAAGFDFDVKHKLLSAKKPYASMDPAKINNALIGNLLLLNINVAMSNNGNTASNLGSLVINDGGMFQNMSINAFLTAANGYMTNWAKVPQTTYDAMNTLADNINNAFAVGFHYDATQWGTGKVVFNKVDSGATVYATSFLKPATEVAPWVSPQSSYPDAVIPTVYALYQNYPNPFNPTTNIRFDLPMQSIVTVKIYNMLGQEIATLNDHELMDAGQTEVAFDANAIASGVYFYRVVAEGSNDNGLANGNTFTKIMKMVLVK